MSLWSFAGQAPRVGRGVFIAPGASVIGAVELGDDASIWFGSVLRADVGPIAIGRRTNVQDLAMVHLTGGVSQTRIGDDVTIGHAVILHGCTVGDRCLIGMGSLLLDNVTVGADSLIGAGSLLTPGMVIPPALSRSVARRGCCVRSPMKRPPPCSNGRSTTSTWRARTRPHFSLSRLPRSERFPERLRPLTAYARVPRAEPLRDCVRWPPARP